MQVKPQRHILFLASWYPNRNKPSHGIFVKRQAEAAALFQKISALHVCSDEKANETYEITQSSENGVKSTVVYYKKVTSAIPVFSGALKFYRYLKAHLLGYKAIVKDAGKPALIHLNIAQRAGIAALLFHFLYKIPFIITEHWSGYMPEDGNYRGTYMVKTTEAIFKRAKAVIVLSEKMRQGLLSHNLNGNGRFYIIPNVVNTEIFCPTLSKKPKSIKKLIHISTINDREKNISGIIEAINLLASERSDFRIDFIGDSEERAFFEEKANNAGLLNRIIFFQGYKDEAETAAYLKEADLKVMFSNFEGLPCVLIEAAACGVPVVATKVGGIPEYFTKELGILVEPRDSKALAVAISEALDNSEKFKPEGIRAYAMEKFSYRSVGQMLAEVYTEVLKNV
jgi:glycosyltransferase involved in cell wall biosynthesis